MRVKTPVTWRMKKSPTRSLKTGASKKRSQNEAEEASQSSSSPSTPHPKPAKEWKKAKLTIEDLLTLINSGFFREKEMDRWRTATSDLYLMEKNLDEIPMFSLFVERGLALPANEFFKGMLRYYCIKYINLNPNGIFHVSVFVQFCEGFMGIKHH
jgi:hypothetical protein